jgi:L-aspartate oxidase
MGRIKVALHAAVRTDSKIRVLEDAYSIDLLDGNGISGALIWHRGSLQSITAPATIVATGGTGRLWRETTNPEVATGDGLAMAYRAGARVINTEYVQFHPTAIDVGLDPMPLATEALRGEGARLIDRDGRFLLGEAADADLQPRDVVARAVHLAGAEGRGAFLDCRAAIGAAFPEEFPAVFAACMRAGLDPRETPIPVAAAAHYHMGGIAAGPDGRTSLPGLFAVGECAATGVHGANRLASNSLLEAAAFGRRTGRAAAAETSGSGATLAPAVAPDLAPQALQTLREAMSRCVGVVRDAAGLSEALAVISRLEAGAPGALPLAAARLITKAALARRESRGGHFRSDFPEATPVAEHTRLKAQSQDAKSFADVDRAA